MNRGVLIGLVIAAVIGAFLTVLTIATALQEPARPREACLLLNVPVVVDLDDVKNKEAIAHVRTAVASGEARILHLERDGAADRRRVALRGVAPRSDRDRDEYPPAVSAEGGAGSDIAYIDPGDNRSAGSLMGLKLRPFCDEQAFIVEP